MTAQRLEPSVRRLGDALDRLDQVLALPGEGPMIDATIQRFEFTVELFWKTLKRALEERGRAVSATPADVIAAAWQADWLEDDETFWIRMLKDRIRSSHLYDEAMAREVYDRIGEYARRLRRAHTDLCRRFRIACPAAAAPSDTREKRPRDRARKKS